MTRKMIINCLNPEEVRVAIIIDGILEDFDIETKETEKNRGNIYLAIVRAVEPALNAAFLDYGPTKQGFLTSHDIHSKYYPGSDDPNHDPSSLSIDEILKPGQQICVQVTKDEVSAKGAVLTTFLSLPGRYLVLMPERPQTASISRKIDDDKIRQQMLQDASKLDLPEGMSVIIRTAGQERARNDLNRDLEVMLGLWKKIKASSISAKAPALIFQEKDVIIRALRDYFTDDIDEIIIDNDEEYDRAEEYLHLVMPHHRSVLTRYVERRPIFHHYRIEEQLETIYQPKVVLKGGGSIVIEPTEALVAIDVNSGKQKSTNQEATATETNLAAAAEVARQLRLRDLGGIVIIDFIDMLNRANQQKVERAMRQAVQNDKARIKISRISPNGTLELTRQRIRIDIGSSVTQSCKFCHGTGHIPTPNSHALQVLRKLRDRTARGDLRLATITIEQQAGNELRTKLWKSIQELQQRYAIRIDIKIDTTFTPGQVDFSFTTNPNASPNEAMEPDFGPAPRFDEHGNLIPPEEALKQIQAERQADKAKRQKTTEKYNHRTSIFQPDPQLQKSIDEFDLPTFRFIDPQRLGLKKRSAKAPHGKSRPHRDDAHGSREQRHRNSDRRRQNQRHDSSQNRQGSRRSGRGMPIAAKAAANTAKKPTMWQRLLRWIS